MKIVKFQMTYDNPSLSDTYGNAAIVANFTKISRLN